MALFLKKSKLKLFVVGPVLLTVLYCEWLAYIPFTWPDLNCGFVTDVHKILFVADPQILGEKTESGIARLDCDSYLRRTFRNAVNYVKPDLIVFLGDLMDEGSIADKGEYERYYQRFRDIFQLDKINQNQTIFIPGDNDIGGEDEAVTEFKVMRFEQHFPSQEVVQFKNMTFYSANNMMKRFPDVNVDNDTTIRVVISHIPLLGIWSSFGEQVISQLKPVVVFSAHDHKLMHLVTGINTSQRQFVESLTGNKWRFNLANSGRVNEIVVPTSSYRMGTSQIGYGVALIGKKGDAMCYFMLWSPKRLHFLFIYLVLVSSLSVAVFIYFLMAFWSRKLRTKSAKYKRLFTEP